MRLHLATGPAVEPISLDEAKLHRRIDGSAEDTLLSDLIVAARETFEEDTGRQLNTATWRLHLDRFPVGREPLVIPKAPLLAVSAITYVDVAGATQTWSAAEYTVTAPAGPYARQGYVAPVPAQNYPSTYRVADAVQVTFTAGYGATAGDVPAAARAAIYDMLGDLYEHREGVVVGTIVSRNPALDRVLDRFRLPVYA